MNDMKKFCNSINSCFTNENSSLDERNMGEIVSLLRVKSRLTQEELAQKANVSTQTIKRLEGGKEKVSDITCREIIEALGVNISRLTKLLDE
ncbi:helix-turn-helix domain-containing protein [Rossellomorea vietnamensis]|uniref:helix-turn-helix transcriptional regulator n=1 Tax=Rossellomorea vietnamensis TaxID=218284 RepID=UPI001CCC15FD|nr:helix-turn-helix transcriptional regulator [Rossellomorea vietnamensis]MCA0148308.1 helix-turn-helix domain-containing protein [Rossellomorea vietnamensis]